MSRSRQAALLARHLAEVTDIEVGLYHHTGARWIAMWADGPLEEEMRTHLDTALAGQRYVAMRDRTIDCHRSTSNRAWAARAIASRREGTLGTAIVEGAAHRRSLGVGMPRRGVHGPTHTHEYYALLRHVDDLCRGTAYPERASAPEDEPLIGQLLEAGSRDRANTGMPTVTEYEMASALLAAEQARAADCPPKLGIIRAQEENR
ncbi:hypothetical protein [Streptomyces sp. t99]|uniref:hypothetical protein n=1 Tax=Streptomyces TaxID=1883 RepID=UPI000BFCE7B6|nr:hypothetical protein [Streptomyces sp. t99]